MTAPINDIAQSASGAIIAQTVVERIREGTVDVNLAWLRFSELSARYGRYSPACRSFVVELAKHAAR